ncbi:alpha-ketoacid dehydrogenase subunit beta [Alkalibacterium pelagium]|uniref:2-oxoisovalerate dehydrogenase E1 component beta subunit n=1 Tax=Alkalibacterium pelagium TaxID=426702 RepID=A0A1H7LZK4_9LACT|nr:alpha-ketoacid dehydrogenase subunit beta [Alkalibacterium pelagium]GEN50998.1 2-oxoisovalerate dehydrogenase subunit beta [Alkalibacterium pelagium]SEL03737.1 2-oxoisovalerate dehydrogenase E1 component beta subunit [Alkalibacterium pelagium]
MAMMTYLEAIRKGIEEEMARDENVVIFGEDVGGVKGGVFGVTKGLAEQFGDDRCFNTPLTEGQIGGLAVGLGLVGYRAIGEFQFADYILPAVNQLISEASRMRYRTKGDWTAPIVYRAPYGGGVRGGLYHSQSTEKVLFGQPGLRIVTPSSPHDAKGLIKAAIRSDDPVLFYEHKRLYRLLKEDVSEEDYVVPLDKANVVREGDDITVIGYGMVLNHALKAAETLSKEGYEAEVVDARSLYPLDKETLVKAAKKTGKVLLVTEDNLEGSIMSEISAIIAEEALFDLDAPIRRLAGPDSPSMPYSIALEREFLVNEEKVTNAMRELAEF